MPRKHKNIDTEEFDEITAKQISKQEASRPLLLYRG
jgi:hypothetical protein